ncbi:MAG: hypothetical protein RL662_2312 [Bacteroidota bacterium]|jgi:DNA-binding LytR/AlgR family response regulator
MRKYTYLIVDDDDMDRLANSFYLKNYSFLEHNASFSSSRAALNYLEHNNIDILFLDIEIPEISGIEFLKTIKNKPLATVFITSHPEFSIEGFELQAFDYIIKPLGQDRFDICVNRLKSHLDLKMKAELFESSFKNESILLKEGYNHVSIQPYEIVYLEALKDYTKIVLLNKKSITIHGNLGTVLNDENFKNLIRIHKSYAVQQKYIQIIKSNEIVLVNDLVLPLGQSYKKNLLDTIT